MKSSKLLLFALVIPLIVGLCLCLIWRFAFRSSGTSSVIVFVIQLLLHSYIMPIYLINVAYRYATKNTSRFALCVVVCIVSLYGSILLDYLNWGTATGTFKISDVSTALLGLHAVVVSTIILAIGLLRVFFIKSRQAKAHKTGRPVTRESLWWS